MIKESSVKPPIPNAVILRNYCEEYGVAPTAGVRLCRPDVVFSVVVPAYNEQDAIGPTLASLGNSQVPIEIIVADNQSTDNTRDVVARTARQMAMPVTVLDAKDGKGPNVGRKRAMDEILAQNVTFGKAEGKPWLMACIDADTVVPANWSQAVWDVYSQGNYSALAGHYAFDPRLDEMIEEKFGIKKFFNQSAQIAAFLQSKGISTLNTVGANMAVDVVSYAQIGGYQRPVDQYGKPKKGSDWRIGNECRKLGKEVGYIPVPTITSARRHIESLRTGVSQASISTMGQWVDVRANDFEYLQNVLPHLSRNALEKHLYERRRAFLLGSVIKPIFQGKKDLANLAALLGSDNEIVGYIKMALSNNSSDPDSQEELAGRVSAEVGDMLYQKIDAKLTEESYIV